MDSIHLEHELNWLVDETVQIWMLFHDEMGQVGNLSFDLCDFALNCGLPV